MFLTSVKWWLWLFGFSQASSGLFLSALLIVLPLESLTHSLFHELGSCLGGTCVGYALVIPTSYSRYCSVFASSELCSLKIIRKIKYTISPGLNELSGTYLFKCLHLCSYHLVLGCEISLSSFISVWCEVGWGKSWGSWIILLCSGFLILHYLATAGWVTYFQT